MIIGGEQVAGCISWFRGYHVGQHHDTTPPKLLENLAEEKKFPIAVFKDLEHFRFWELSTLRNEQVARGKLLTPGCVEGKIKIDKSECDIRAEFDTHILLHRSGMLVLRPTARFDRVTVEGGGGVTVEALQSFERALWEPNAKLAWYMNGADECVAEGWGRNFLNYVFLDIFTCLAGRRQDVAVLQRWAAETGKGSNGLLELYRRKLLEHPYPVTFGSETQLVLGHEGRNSDEWLAHARKVACDILCPLTPSVDVNLIDVEDDSPRVCWFFDENRAVTIVQQAEFPPKLDVIDADRTQTIEFLTVRRAALSSVRRATQLSVTEGHRISRRQVTRWRNLVTATTDDYVLDARIGCLLDLIYAGYRKSPRLRDIADMEEQVRTNLETIQAQIDADANRTGRLIATLLGAGGLVLALQHAVQPAVAAMLGVSGEDVPGKYAGVLVVAQLVLVALSFLVSYLIVRTTSSTWTGDRRPRWQRHLWRLKSRFTLNRAVRTAPTKSDARKPLDDSRSLEEGKA